MTQNENCLQGNEPKLTWRGKPDPREQRSVGVTAVYEVDLLFKSVDDMLECENSNKSH